MMKRDILTPSLVIGGIIIAVLLLWAVVASGQTHTMPGSNVVPSGASLTIQSGGTINAAAGSTVTGFAGGGGNVSNSGTPTVNQKAVWVDATHIQGVADNALQWDGGATSLVAATGRTSLGATTTGSNLFTLATPGATSWLEISSAGAVTATNAATTRTDLGGTTVGQSFFTLTNPGAITFPEISATNVVSTKTAAQLKTDLSLTSTDVGLGSVTNNAQTQAAIVPNTAPGGGQILAGNVGGTAYAPVTVSGSGATISLASTGVMTISAIAPASINAAAGVSTFLTTPSSANLSTALTDETGTGGALVFGSSPTITTPTFTTGFKIGGTAASGTIAIGNGTNYVASTPTYPNAAGTSGVILQSNGTNIITSTPTWPTTVGTAGYGVTSNGSTGYAAYPTQLVSSSTATVSAGYAADTYLAGSSVTVAAGDFKVGGQYHCVFDMTKTGAGIATPIIIVRAGTAGTTADAAICTLTFSAGTAVIDSGMFEVYVVFRTVGSGTTAVFQAIGTIQHQGGVTGLVSKNSDYAASTSSGFNSTTQTKLGLSFNGGLSFAGTNLLVQAQLEQP